MSRLIDLTRQAFEADGPLARALKAQKRKYTPNLTQVAYAEAVAKTLDAGRDDQDRAAVSLLEAETGSGKSLGYLVPLCLHLALNRERGFVATHTHQLMSVLLEREAPVAVAVAEELTGVRLNVAQRLGIGSWLSPFAIESLYEAMEDENPRDDRLPTLQSLLNYAEDAKKGGTLRGWLTENEGLPRDVLATDVTLVSGKEKGSEAYQRHLANAADADLLIVSHALLAVDLMRYLRILGDADDLPITVGIVDEGDHLPRAVERAMSSHVSAPTLMRLAAIMDPKSAGRLTEAVEDFRAFMDRVRHERPEVERSRFMRLSIAGATASYTAEAREKVRAMKEAIDAWNPVGVNARDIDDAQGWSHDLNSFLLATEEATRAAAALSWSPVLAFPSVSVVPLRAARAIGRAWKPSRPSNTPPPKRDHLHAMVITSATLGDPGGAERPFQDYQHELGLIQDEGRDWAYYLEDVSGRFAPTKFGALKFAVSHSDAPTPPRPNEDGVIDPDELAIWRDYVASVGLRAHGEGGRVLLLATSFADAEAIAERVSAGGVTPLVEVRGGAFDDMLKRFTADDRGFLISLRWEGLDLPGLIDHLVISRLPYPYAGDLRLKLLKQELMESRNFTEDAARGIMIARASRLARARLKQGIGRALRSPTDRAKVWFADARFPPPRAMVEKRSNGVTYRHPTFKPFVNAIPARFREGMRETYGSAELIPFSKVG